jgi:AraC family transcriptional regulator
VKERISMNRLRSIKASLEYIENNLRGEVDLALAAKKACLSKFYYYSMFQIVTGMTLAEYIRNRKMTLAAKEIKESGSRIIDIAVAYGYGSQESFSRAFKSVQGITPAQARAPSAQLKAYPPISFQLQLKGDVEMDYKIVKKDAVPLIGMSRSFSTVDGANFRDIPKFWEETMQDGSYDKLCKLAEGGQYSGCFGICMDFDEDADKFNYVIAVSGTKEEGKFKKFTVPADTYAVFGPVPLADLQNLWKRIFSEWVPATEYEISYGPQVEYYFPGGDDAVPCEVWIPIKK